MKKILLISATLILAFLAFSPLPVSEVQAAEKLDLQLIDSSDQGISLELRIDWQNLRLEKQIVEGKTYLKASLPGATQSSQPGAPDLPVMLASLGIPFGVELEISVTAGKAHEMMLSAPLLPVETEQTTRQVSPDHQKLQDAYSTESSLIEEVTIYKSAAPFPAAQAVLSQDAVVRQQRIVGVQLYPLQYQPAAEKLTVFEDLFIEIRFLGTASERSQADYVPESAVYEAFFRESLLNYESARNWRSFQTGQENAPTQQTGTLWLPPEPSWRIQVRQEGMYRVSYEELEMAGLPVTTLDPSTFQLYHLGSEIAMLVNSASEHEFVPGDSLVFYGEKIESKYTWDNVYWLTFGQAQGLRMESVNGTPGGNPIVSHYQEVQHNEQNLNYVNYIPAADEFEHFLGKFISTKHPSYRTITITFGLNDVFDGSGTLKLALLGYLNSAHQATITFNGAVLSDDITWDAFDWKNIEISLPAGSLVEGVNTVIISSTNDNDRYYLDWMELVYARQLVSKNDSLLFDFGEVGDWGFDIEGFSAADLDLFDVSSPALVKQIIDFNIEPVEGSFTLQFGTEIAETKRFWSGTSNSYLGAESIIQDIPSDWQSSSHGADYIVVTHEAFFDQAIDLANFRASQGLRVAVVDVQDVYDEFGYGITGSQPIRSFLNYAYGNWESPAPSYVVLIGDGHFDPKNYMGFGRKSYLPPYLANVDPELGETAADNRYVAFIGEDIFPDMMLGRLAVNSTADAQGFVDKIIAYEESPETNDWNRQVLAVSDNDKTWPFPYTSDELLRCCLPSSYEANRVYLEATHPDTASAKEAVIAEINAGKLLVNYIGHAAASQWSEIQVIEGPPTVYIYGLLSVKDISRLNNLNKYPVFLSMTCWDGYYVYPNPTGGFYEAMAEVFTKAANKGAVAAWSATGMGVARGHEYLNQGFFNAVFRDGLADLGQATSYGKLYLWTSTANLDLMDTYLLFGDPATKINVPGFDHYLPLILK